MKPFSIAALSVIGMMSLAACKTQHDVNVHIDPVEVKPIQLDVNIRVQRDLDDFFDFEKNANGTHTQPQGAQP